MPNQRSVAVLVGSLRKESFTRKIANALIGLAPPSLRMEIVEIGSVSFYNQDLEFLKSFIDAYAAWVELILAGRS